MPIPEAFESSGSVRASLLRISAGDVAPITSSPSAFRARICRRRAAMRRSRIHQMTSNIENNNTEANKNGARIIHAFSSIATEAGPGIKI